MSKRGPGWILAAALVLFAALGTVPVAAQEFRAGNVLVADPWMRATARANFAAPVYFDLTLAGEADDVFLGATSPIAGEVEIRELRELEGVIRNFRLEQVPIAPGGYRLAPSGIHLAILRAPVIAEGSTVTVILNFQNAGALEIQVPVLGLRAADPRAP